MLHGARRAGRASTPGSGSSDYGSLLGLIATPAIVRAANIMPVRTMIWQPSMLRTPCFGALECYPARYTDLEAWVYDINVLHPNEWRELEAWEVYGKAGVMSEAKFNKAFGELPPLPKGAFQS